MQPEQKLLFAFETVVGLVIFLTCIGVFFPIWSVTNNYPHYYINTVFIICFILGVRYLFGLKHSFIGSKQEWKIGFILLMVPVFFLLVSNFTSFLAWLEDESIDSVTGHLPEADRLFTNKFIRREMTFFGIGSIIASVLLPIRLMVSIWQQRKATLMTRKKNVFLDEDEY